MSISMIIDHKIQITTLSEIYLNLGQKVTIYSRKQLIKDIEESGIETFDFVDLDVLKEKYYIRKLFHKILLILFTRSDYSFQFKMVNKKYTENKLKKALNIFSLFFPKVRNQEINHFLTKWMSLLFSKNVFNSSKIICTSLNSSGFLLANNKLSITTIMESWDHAVKTPNGYSSKIVFCWNKSLQKDWMTKQGDKNCLVHYPSKLRYSKRNNEFLDSKKTNIVYVAATTKRFSISTIYNIELRLLKELAPIIENNGFELVIKLRPNGSESDFEELPINIKKIGIQEKDIKFAPDYIINQDYNDKRFIEMRNTYCVINTFSTFGIDCVLAGIPVIQLNLSNTAGFEDSWEIYERPHLKNYLISHKSVISPSQLSDLNSCLKNSNLYSFNDDLLQWLEYPDSEQKVLNETCNYIRNFL